MIKIKMRRKGKMGRLSLEAFYLLWLAFFAISTLFLHFLYEYKHRSLRNVAQAAATDTTAFSPGIKPTNTKYNVAIIIPYIDQPLPAWFDAFVRSTAQHHANSDQYDVTIHWLIFHNRPDINYYNSTNVKIFFVENQVLARRFQSIQRSAEHPELTSTVWKPKIPYRMVEYKAAFGYLFRDYLQAYSHWGYGDLDILASVSYLQQLLGSGIKVGGSPALLQSYDVITFTYGDHFSLYLRGQLTIFKKTHITVYDMWKHCPLGDTNDGPAGGVRKGMQGFQSAEGCISKVVTNYYTAHNMSILYLPLQLSDALLLRGRAQEAHSQYALAERESLYYTGRLMKCYLNSSGFSFVSEREFAQHYLQTPEPLRVEAIANIEGRSLVHSRQPRCAYWVAPEFDVCVDHVPPNAIIMRPRNSADRTSDDEINTIGNNRFYFTNAYRKPFGGCIEAAVMHFQGWKRNYFVFTSRAALLADASRTDQVTVVSRNGLIPWQWTEPQQRGRARYDDWASIHKPSVHSAEETQTFLRLQEEQLPSRYCLHFSIDLKTCDLWLDGKQHVLVQQIPQEYRSSFEDNEREATLLLLLPSRLMQDSQMAALEAYLQSLHDEVEACTALKFLVVVVARSSKHIRVRLKTSLEKTYKQHGTIIRLVLVNLPVSPLLSEGLHPGEGSLDKTLYNVGLDCVSARFSRLTSSSAFASRVFVHPMGEVVFSRRIWNLMWGAWKQVRVKEDMGLVFGSLDDTVGPQEMQAVLFNLHSSKHGQHALRFPEELNGQLCVANVLLSVMQGLGYDVFEVTADLRSAEQPMPLVQLRSTIDFSSLLSAVSDGYCIMSSHRLHWQVFLDAVDLYYTRMSELRSDNRGIVAVASTRVFAFGAASNVFYEAQPSH